MLLTAAGCSSQSALDAPKLKMIVDGQDSYVTAKVRVAQPFSLPQ
jgi:hypothetical protein